ncbi:MAG TPA: DUF72 domain-containing protein [Thermoanaerobaculia bacterium]|jgi:hypothetical protein|nr:DUF72 domain-containing protein [Thermoanaerobaculia bacterium]
MSILIGTQGWNYAAWVGPLYPPGTRPAEFLSTYARAFRTVEVDSTFYAVPDARGVRAWAEHTPSEFTFALKMPKEVTHERRLRDADDVVGDFLDRARQLGPKLETTSRICTGVSSSKLSAWERMGKTAIQSMTSAMRGHGSVLDLKGFRSAVFTRAKESRHARYETQEHHSDH